MRAVLLCAILFCSPLTIALYAQDISPEILRMHQEEIDQELAQLQQDELNLISAQTKQPASCITFLSEQAFAPQNTRFWSRSRVWFQFTVGEDKPPMLSVDNRGKGVLSMDCSAKRSPL